MVPECHGERGNQSNFLFLFSFYIFVLVFETRFHPLTQTGLNIIVFLLTHLPSTEITGMSHHVWHNFLSNMRAILSFSYSWSPLIQTPWLMCTFLPIHWCHLHPITLVPLTCLSLIQSIVVISCLLAHSLIFPG